MQIDVWLMTHDEAEGIVTVYGTEAEARAAWRTEAEELWREHCEGDPPADNTELCNRLQDEGDCTAWGVIERHAVNIPDKG